MNVFSIFLGNFLAIVVFSNIVSLNTFGMVFFKIITPKIMKRFPYHDLKLVPFTIGIELMLAVKLAGVFITEHKITDNQNKLT